MDAINHFLFKYIFVSTWKIIFLWISQSLLMVKYCFKFFIKPMLLGLRAGLADNWHVCVVKHINDIDIRVTNDLLLEIAKYKA
jgi:hypothetical protein